MTLTRRSRRSNALRLSVLVLCSCIASIPSAQAEPVRKLSEYVDSKTGVVTAPPGFADNDDCWRSAWFHASVIVLQANDRSTYERLVRDHGIDVSMARTFLAYFRDNCIGDTGWKRATTLRADFSRDQLLPLLYLIGCVKKYGPADCEGTAKAVLQSLVQLDKKHGYVSDTAEGSIGPNLRYVIAVLAEKYDIDYANGNERALYKEAFGLALKAHSIQVQLPGEAGWKGDFSQFNTLALVTLQRLFWGSDDDDVKSWRRHYRQHADKGWGPAFRIVSGREVDDGTIERYYTARIKRSEDNDIVLAQRGHKYLSDSFPTPQLDRGEEEDAWLVLDFPILKALQVAWK